MEFDRLFDKYSGIISKLGNNLSLDRIKMVILGVGTHKEATFMSVWEDMIHKLKTENDGARCTTAESYEYALRSFRKIMWKHPITGFKIGKEEIEQWSDGMKNGVKDAQGETAGKISDTTRGIYLPLLPCSLERVRTARVPCQQGISFLQYPTEGSCGYS